MKISLHVKFVLAFALVGLVSCEENDENPGFRPKMSYSVLDATAPYAAQFHDADGQSTVDPTEGNHLHQMFLALNYHSTSAVAAETTIDASALENMFSNTGNPFYDIQTLNISGQSLNASAINLRDAVASSLPSTEADQVRTRIEGYFSDMEAVSQFVTHTASRGVAGKLGGYLLDEKGVEIAQVIQKGLIGALQLDYIGNVLMDEGLTADNSQTVGDKNYTQLEHNWDQAYGLLTLKDIYLEGYTEDTKGTGEFGGGAYLWEYNRANYNNIYPAFLKGRAAIVNNDKAELQVQATFIRTEFEKSIAGAALGYLDKWKTGTTDAARAHAIGEGLGFIYSLRFAELHDADAAFSDEILNNLMDSEDGFWDLTATKINAASDAIRAKFNL